MKIQIIRPFLTATFLTLLFMFIVMTSWATKSPSNTATVDHTTQTVEVLRSQNEQLLQRQRFTTGGLMMIMGIAALLVFLVYSSRWSRQLEIKNRQLQRERNVVVAAHSKLQAAYQQLEETTTAKERIESELRIARDIQMSMVPNVFPQRKGLDFYGAMMPARDVGGDLYDYLLEGDRLYFCIGDVSGKGVPASLLMAQATRMFRILAKQHQMPANIAARLNDELSEKNENGMFVTMFIALLDLQTGHLYFCNAGHNPPVLGGDEHHGSFITMESNAPIGLWPSHQYVGEEIESIVGRPLFLYTDGLNEAENPEQQQFGDDRLLDILRNTSFESTRQIIADINAEVVRHRRGAESSDDLTMLCLNLTSTAPRSDHESNNSQSQL